ncbi:MAG: type II secretion system protein [Candidatus Margulisiibacteriota bacterium]
MKMARRGFTLIEMILVLVVITIALFPLIESFSSGIRGSKIASDTNTAIELAQQKMEQLQSIPFASLSNSSEALGTIAGFAFFSREATVTEPLTNLKEVTVNVYWKSGIGTDQFGISSYFINY